MDSRQKLHLITLKLQDSVAQTKLAEKSICLAWYSLSSFARKKEHLIYDLWSKVKTGSKTPRRLSKTKVILNLEMIDPNLESQITGILAAHNLCNIW